jgi:uncharacterized membrane protein YedE/YeeE
VSFVLPLLGGGLIGLSASLVLLLHGRVAGIAGLFGGLFLPGRDARLLRLAFVLGLAGAGLAFALLHPSTLASTQSPSLVVAAVAGLLVGFGTQLGGGCTSGHGICGMSRLSPRSIVATLTFMATGALTVLVVNHVLGWSR